MAREPIGWRRWVICIGFYGLSLMFFAMAAGAWFGGVAFGPRSRAFGVLAARPWTVMPIESPVMQAIVGTLFALVGVVLVRLGYKALREGRDGE